jgi:hypothetical protein
VGGQGEDGHNGHICRKLKLVGQLRVTFAASVMFTDGHRTVTRSSEAREGTRFTRPSIPGISDNES